MMSSAYAFPYPPIYNRKSMQPARIAELLKPFLSPAPTSNPCHSEPAQSGGEEPAVLAPSQLHHISTFINTPVRWNARITRPATRAEDKTVPRHFGESLFAAPRL